MSVISQIQCLAVVNSEKKLVRKRRDWVLPPKPLTENVDYTKDEYVAKVSQSDGL